MDKCDDLEFARLIYAMTKDEKKAYLEALKLISRRGVERPKSSKSL